MTAAPSSTRPTRQPQNVNVSIPPNPAASGPAHAPHTRRRRILGTYKLRHEHSPGRAFYDRKRAEGHTTKNGIRALKRRISNVVYRHLVADNQRVAST